MDPVLGEIDLRRLGVSLCRRKLAKGTVGVRHAGQGDPPPAARASPFIQTWC